MVLHIPRINKIRYVYRPQNKMVQTALFNKSHCLSQIKEANINDNKIIIIVLKRAETWQGFIFIKAVVV